MDIVAVAMIGSLLTLGAMCKGTWLALSLIVGTRLLCVWLSTLYPHERSSGSA